MHSVHMDNWEYSQMSWSLICYSCLYCSLSHVTPLAKLHWDLSFSSLNLGTRPLAIPRRCWCSVHVASTNCWSHWWTDRNHSHCLCSPITVAIEQVGPRVRVVSVLNSCQINLPMTQTFSCLQENIFTVKHTYKQTDRQTQLTFYMSVRFAQACPFYIYTPSIEKIVAHNVM